MSVLLRNYAFAHPLVQLQQTAHLKRVAFDESHAFTLPPR